MFRDDEEIGPLSPLTVSVAAGFSSSIAAAASHCFDTAKSRSQCIVLPKVFSLLNKELENSFFFSLVNQPDTSTCMSEGVST